jgi:hypothetical protein
LILLQNFFSHIMFDIQTQLHEFFDDFILSFFYFFQDLRVFVIVLLF